MSPAEKVPVEKSSAENPAEKLLFPKIFSGKVPAGDVPAGKVKLAVVLVRGTVGAWREVRETLDFLRLRHKNHAAILDYTPSLWGMLRKVKDYVTWGEISEEVFAELLKKRGKESKGRTADRKGLYQYKVLSEGRKKYLPYFRLNPPRKGFGRKGIKVSFPAGGALGYRGEKINDLLRRMI